MYTGRPGGKKKKEKRREEKVMGRTKLAWGEEGGVTCKVKLRVPAFWASLPFNLCLLFGTYCGVGGVLSFGGGASPMGAGVGRQGRRAGFQQGEFCNRRTPSFLSCITCHRGM